MQVAIMQPYLFPYLGYYQLAACVDQFVFCDDVKFITRGFINRNSILAQYGTLRITMTVAAASQNRNICEHRFAPDSSKVIETIRHAYHKAPHYSEVFPRIRAVLEAEDRDVTALCRASIATVMDYLELPFRHRLSSAMDYDRQAGRTGRLVDICKRLGADTYVNSIGGTALYKREEFALHGIDLRFLKMRELEYPQRKGQKHFVPKLSMIDTLMWCDPQHVRELLTQYDLI